MSLVANRARNPDTLMQNDLVDYVEDCEKALQEDDALVKRIARDKPLQRLDYAPVLGVQSHNDESYLRSLGPKEWRLIIKYLTIVAVRNDCVLEFFIDQRGKLWFKLRASIDSTYPRHVERVTGSKLAALVGLSRKTALPADVFRAWTGRLRPSETVVVEDNADMTFGRTYEGRVRCIVSRLFCEFYEPGFFVHMKRQEYGVSPDGVTRGNVTLVVNAQDAAMLQRRAFDPAAAPLLMNILLGILVLEIKCSRYGLKEYIQLEHIVQMHLEMWLAHSRYGLLAYWHQDQMQLWLVEFCDSFWVWIDDRVGKFLAACKRGDAQLSEELATSIAWELQAEWFPDKYGAMPWSAKKRKLCPPERPRTWLLFQEKVSRSTERTHETLDGRAVYPTQLEPNDPWFTNAWLSLPDEQARPNSTHTLRVRAIHVT